jgi:hypothetical protein
VGTPVASYSARAGQTRPDRRDRSPMLIDRIAGRVELTRDQPLLSL